MRPAKMLTRRQVNERAFKKERQRLRNLKGIAPVRDESYKDWIRYFPCLVTISRTYGITDSRKLVDLAYSKRASEWVSEAAHTGDDKGMRMKASDTSCIPLSKFYHTGGPHSHHKLTPTPVFFAFHGLDRDQIISALNELYEKEKAA